MTVIQEDFDLKRFHQRIIDLLDEMGIKAKEACKGANIGRGAITTWKKGSIPSVDKVFRLAKYLNRSVQWLITGEDGLKADEQKLLDVYNQLNNTGKEAAISTVRGLASSFPQLPEQDGESIGTAI